VFTIGVLLKRLIIVTCENVKWTVDTVLCKKQIFKTKIKAYKANWRKRNQNTNLHYLLHKGQITSSTSAAVKSTQISWTCSALYRSPCVFHFIPSGDETETALFRFIRRDFIPFAQKDESLFSYHPLFMAILHWMCLFSLLPPGNLMILLFFLLSKRSMELTECCEMSLVLRSFNVLVFLVKVQRLHSSLDHHHLLSQKTAYQDSSCLVRNVSGCTTHRRSFRVFCDKGAGAGVSISFITLENWASSILTLCYKAASKCYVAVIEGMNG
jgi:hypothetical protein